MEGVRLADTEYTFAEIFGIGAAFLPGNWLKNAKLFFTGRNQLPIPY